MGTAKDEEVFAGYPFPRVARFLVVCPSLGPVTALWNLIEFSLERPPPSFFAPILLRSAIDVKSSTFSLFLYFFAQIAGADS
jgi:hypothetical protein